MVAFEVRSLTKTTCLEGLDRIFRQIADNELKKDIGAWLVL
jgi:hypothetical protein